MQLLPYALTLAAAATLAWTSAELAQAPQLPSVSLVRGDPIDRTRTQPVEDEPVQEWGVPPLEETIDFERFAFDDYDPPELRPDPAPLAHLAFPEPVRVLHGAEVRVSGYPQIALLSGGRIHELMLTRFPPGCCFGAMPVFDEWILVELAEPLDPMDLGVGAEVIGKLDIGEKLSEDGFVENLYRMHEAKVAR